MFLVTFSFTCSCAVVRVGGAVASWLVRSAPNRAVWFDPWPRTLHCVPV